MQPDAPDSRVGCFTSHRPEWQPRPLHAGLRLSSDAALEAAGRTRCPQCEKSNAFYCCDCLLPLTPDVPAVTLPFNLFVCARASPPKRRGGGDTPVAAACASAMLTRNRAVLCGSVTHAQQNLTSATGVHLALLAPSQVRLLGVEELPALDARTAVVLFPDDEALPAEEVDVSSVTDVIVIDSKWGQARGVVASDKLRGLRHVRIGAYVTSYWRRDRSACRLVSGRLATHRRLRACAGITPPACRRMDCARSRRSFSCVVRCVLARSQAGVELCLVG
jgi:hypothetical protein